MKEMVQVYDLKSKTISTIPASELAPGMVHAQVEGVGLVWIAATQARPGPYQHGPFSKEVRDYLRQIKQALDEVYPQTLEQWEDGFRRDRNVERQIALWLHISSVYRRFTVDKNLSAEACGDYFDVVLTITADVQQEIFVIAIRSSQLLKNVPFHRCPFAWREIAVLQRKNILGQCF
jgi:hypothetical protein